MLSPHRTLTFKMNSWVKRDQLDIICFIISLFTTQHVSDVNTSILRSLRLIWWVNAWLCFSVRIEVFALAYLFSGECLVVTCVVDLVSVFLQMLAGAVSYGYWVFFVCGMFLIMFPAHILMSYIWAYTYLVRCVLVLRCGGVVSTPHHHNITPTHIEPEQYNPCINSSNKSQAPEDGCINIWNKLSSK